jgi:uncharacterized protein
MSARQTIDSMHFAQSGGQFSGELGADALPRLADILPRESAVVQYLLQGETHMGRPAIRLRARVTVQLVCQRCLGTYAEDMVMERVYPIARDDAELARWEREDPLLDALVAEPRMAVPELIEDEILLSLPTVPRHPEGMCDTAMQAMIQ